MSNGNAIRLFKGENTQNSLNVIQESRKDNVINGKIILKQLRHLLKKIKNRSETYMIDYITIKTVKIVFWSSGIIECMLFTFENRGPLMREGA